MKAAGKKRVGALLLAMFVAACASIPNINFEDGGSSATSSPPITDASFGSDDAGASHADGGSVGNPSPDAATPDGGVARDASSSDAGARTDAAPPGDDAGEDSGPPDQDGDDAGEAGATILCGTTLVTNCAGCADGPLRCKRNGADRCVDDCTTCAANWYPCLHCPTNKALPRGACLPLTPAGEIQNCDPTNTNFCPCMADTDCTAVPGAAQVCTAGDGGKSHCLACGTASTDGLACVTSAKVPGTCAIAADASPTCE